MEITNLPWSWHIRGVGPSDPNVTVANILQWVPCSNYVHQNTDFTCLVLYSLSCADSESGVPDSVSPPFAGFCCCFSPQSESTDAAEPAEQCIASGDPPQGVCWSGLLQLFQEQAKKKFVVDMNLLCIAYQADRKWIIDYQCRTVPWNTVWTYK